MQPLMYTPENNKNEHEGATSRLVCRLVNLCLNFAHPVLLERSYECVDKLIRNELHAKCV